MKNQIKNKLAKKYIPKQVESEIYSFWERNGYFKADVNPAKKPFTVMIPPPNVTGSLHIGHALNNTVIDILIRWKRMRGYEALYQPGTDHAGIATQNKVEQKIAKEGKSRFDLGREKFEQEVWKWKERYQKRIIGQLKSLGCSCDWSRDRFTLDPNYSQAVRMAFEHYYQKGWIYQGSRVVNWCPRCATSISDIEVNHLEQKAKLYYFRYDEKFPITIATTRPETKLGDTAVAVNPEDKRFHKYLGKTFAINFLGVKRKIKIVADEKIDMKFGSGALGVTPAHSLTDEKIAKENKLKSIQVIDESGRITKEGSPTFAGLKVLAAREKIVRQLKENGLLEKTEIINNNLAVCDRCHTPVEPLPSLQWFLKMSELAKPAISAVKNEEIKFHPKRWKKVYLRWLKKADDWCISRQLWWGHKLPIWQLKVKDKKAKNKNNFYVGENPPTGYIQSEDVLDTWFSSALWPIAVFLTKNRSSSKIKNQKSKSGEAEKIFTGLVSEDLNYFYPTQILSTARDIIFLWVARMIFSGIELTGKNPFSDIFIHPTVLTEEGKRMSKSLGTGIDPADLIEKYGADALRFGIAWHLTGLQDIRFKEDTIITARNFCNKIWNASRFVDMNLGNVNKIPDQVQPKTPSDEKILKQLDEVILYTNRKIKNYKFGHAAQKLYHFFWHQFCDSYLEESKKQLQDIKLKVSTQKILLYILSVCLRLLHPFIPFVTEEIWQKLGAEKPLIISEWPKTKVKTENPKS